jgi:hypothetical protein
MSSWRKNNQRNLQIAVVVFFVLVGNSILSQDMASRADSVYGHNSLLYNGVKYSFYVPSRTGGHQFLSTRDFTSGSVVIKGAGFDVTGINYDVYNQEILIQYENAAGGLDILSLSKAWIDHFHIGEKRFEILEVNGTQQICQVIPAGNLKVIYHWSKTLKLDMQYGSRDFIFSEPERESYIMTGNSWFEFRNNKTFVKAFDPELQPEIRRSLKLMKINVKRSSDTAMLGLLVQCEELMK